VAIVCLENTVRASVLGLTWACEPSHNRLWCQSQPGGFVQAHTDLVTQVTCVGPLGRVTRSKDEGRKGWVMLSPYGLDIIESCLTCKTRSEHLFCDLPAAALQTFESIKYATAYPKGAVLFVEGQAPRGIFVLCKGRVKMSICATDGKTLIVKIAEPGEVLGLSATVSGKPYELTAETVDPCQVNFVKRDDFLRFLKEHSDACFKVAEQLSEKYNSACHEVRSLGLSHSAGEKLAKLLLEWSSKNGEATKQEPRLKLALTHEEIAQMIGTSRETVTRLFADLKKRQIIQTKGSTLVIRNKSALRMIASNN
jgi:CRP/FNR family transcriptional regulator, cyclic AMP receptor protein